MSEHLTQNQVEDYYRQKLSVAELLSVSDHLGACETCRHEVTRAVNSDAVFFALRSEVFGEVAEALPSSTVRTHLTSEQIAEYVDGVPASEEPQVIKDHLTGGDQCALAANDLRAFRNEVAPGPKRKYHPAMVSAPIESWRHRLVASLSSLHLPSPALAFGSALTVLLLVVTGWLVWQRRQEKETKSQIVATAPSPTESPIPVPEGTANPVIELNDSQRRIVLDSKGKLSGADYLPPDCQRILKDALTSQGLEKSALLAGLARPGSALMSGDRQGNQFSVIEPVGKVMLSDRPTFRWSQLQGATGYVVEAYDEQFRPVATSPQLTSDSWTVQQPLQRGRVYSWQVKAIKDGLEFKSPRPPAPQAKFRILDQAKTNELAQARLAYASSHLTLGLLYVQAGLLDEAEQELRALQKNNPDAATVRRWLASVEAMRR